MSAAKLQAFNGDASVRTGALAQLQAHLDAKQLSPGVMFWNGKEGSVSACLVDSGELDVWKARLGLAPWLACALDATTGALLDGRAVDIAANALHNIAVGTDTTTIGSRVASAVLERLPATPSESAREDLIKLHGRVADGDAPSNAEWRAVRKKATTATDAAATGDEKAACECIEAAAWDPGTSPTSVGDVLRLWARFLSCNIDEELGWTREKDALAHKRLAEMNETYILPNPGTDKTVFELLEEHYPEFEKELRAYVVGQTSLNARNAQRAAELLVATLEKAA